MAASLFVMAYLLAGQGIVLCQLPQKRLPIRLWLGLAVSLFLMMWLPALLAFFRPFDALNQVLSLGLLLLVLIISFVTGSSAPTRPASAEDKKTLILLLLTALPLFAVSFYLQYTHMLRPAADGLHTGQSCYGDLPLHLGIINSLRGATLPADYSILPGVQLSYPFLSDSLSTSFRVLGLNLQLSLLVPGALMLLSVFVGFALLAERLAHSRRAAALAVFLVFLNGGLGFLYAFDMAGVSLGSIGENQLQQGVWLDRIQNILQGWYQTPANHAEFTRYNLRMSNIIVDMLTPQRSFLAGWAILIPCLYLLFDGFLSDWPSKRVPLLLGLLAGGLPLIHTHSFLALGLCSLGLLLNALLRKKPLTPFILFAGFTLALALPQLLGFTFKQSRGEGFLRFQFNWVNNSGGQGLRDGYLWFYIKNIGLPFIVLIFCLFEKHKSWRTLFSGAFMILVAAEFILFQPNEYDNNKLIYVWWMLCAIPVADGLYALYRRLKGIRARPLIAGFAAFLMFLTGFLSLSREALSDFRLYSTNDEALASYVEENTSRDSLFITGTQHLNPVSGLAGRNIVCGPGLWLYYHGLNIRERETDLRDFYENPNEHRDFPLRIKADYILIGPFERSSYAPDTGAFDALYPRVFESEEHLVYRVKP